MCVNNASYQVRSEDVCATNSTKMSVREAKNKD